VHEPASARAAHTPLCARAAGASAILPAAALAPRRALLLVREEGAAGAQRCAGVGGEGGCLRDDVRVVRGVVLHDGLQDFEEVRVFSE